jgi:putative ABC transport system permease protein
MAEGQVDIGVVGLLASLVLVVVAVLLSLRQRLGISRRIVVASIRVLVQLLLVGLALQLILDPDTPLAWSWLWVAGIIGFASWTVRRRATEVPQAMGLALASIGAAGVVTLGVVFGLGIFPLEARFLVPTAGMMVGNAMQYTILAGRRLVDELRDNRAEVETRLALGQPWQDAARPHVRRAIRDAITPQVERTRSVGLVFLPGAMTGLILAGVPPLQAVLVQAAVMYLILGAVATSAVTIAQGLTRRLFTRDHRLLPLPRPAEG